MGLKQENTQLLVVLATLNEEQGITPTIKELKNVLEDPEFLVIDGRSIDGTIERVKKLNIEIFEQMGKGKGDAIAQGIRFADFSGKYVVLVDADFTYPAEFIPPMLRILDKRPWVGMVCGNRFNNIYSIRGMKSLYSLGNKILSFSHNFFNGISLVDPLTGLRVIRWEVLRRWHPRSLGFDIEVELNHFVKKQGYEIVEVPIGLRSRLGEKKLNILDGLAILKRIMIERK